MKFFLIVFLGGLLSAGLYFWLQQKNLGPARTETTATTAKTAATAINAKTAAIVATVTTVADGKAGEVEANPGRDAVIWGSNEGAGPKKMLPDYDVYRLRKQEWLFYFGLAAAGCFFVAYVFYRNLLLAALVTLLALYYPRLKTKEIIVKRKQELAMQFKEALYALSSSLTAGRSVEEAFKEAVKDLALIYPDPQTYIIQEFSYIVRRLEMNETIEEALADFAGRAHLEDIDSFVDVFVISKRTGGNIVEIIKNTSAIIGDKLQIKQEIDTLLAERKFERKILNIMPIAMILLLSWSTGDYMAPVFNTLAGHFAMTVAVLLLGAAFFISGKIMKIEV